MRMTSQISFWREQRRYNPKTSRYEGEPVMVDQVWGNVTDLGLTKSVQLFGNYAQRALVVRLMRPAVSGWSYLTIGKDGRKYRLQTARDVSKGNTLIVGEDNGQN